MLTTEQINQIRANSAKSNVVGKFDYLKNTNRKKGFVDNVKEAVVKRADDVNKTVGGDMNPLSAGLQFWGAGAGLVNDVLGAGINKIAPGVTEKIGEVAKKVINTKPAQKIISSYEEFKAKHPEAAKDLEAATNILSLLPAGKGIGIGTKGIKEGSKIVGESARPVLGKTLSTAGAVGEKVGTKIMAGSLVPTEEQALKTVAYNAKKPLIERISLSANGIDQAPKSVADVAAKYNLAGLSLSEIGTRAKRISNQLWETKVNPALDSIKGTVSKDEIFSSIKKEISQIGDISKRKSFEKGFEALAEDYKHVSGWSYKKLDKITSEMSSYLPTKVWKGEEVKDAFNKVRQLFTNKSREIVRTKMPQEIRDIYTDYGSLKELYIRGAKNLKEGITGGALSLLSKEIKSAAVPLTTIPGLVINKTGTVLKRAGQSLLKK